MKEKYSQLHGEELILRMFKVIGQAHLGLDTQNTNFEIPKDLFNEIGEYVKFNYPKDYEFYKKRSLDGFEFPDILQQFTNWDMMENPRQKWLLVLSSEGCGVEDITKLQPDDVCWGYVPKDFWKEHGHLDDSCEPLEIPGFHEVMEQTLACDKDYSLQEQAEQLRNMGFEVLLEPDWYYDREDDCPCYDENEMSLDIQLEDEEDEEDEETLPLSGCTAIYNYYPDGFDGPHWAITLTEPYLKNNKLHVPKGLHSLPDFNELAEGSFEYAIPFKHISIQEKALKALGATIQK